jgi:lysophospholipase L1-like esterase
LLDIHNLMIRKPEWKAFLSGGLPPSPALMWLAAALTSRVHCADGLHLSPVGQAFLADELLNLLRTGPWNPKQMPQHYPAHIDIFKVACS